MNLIKKHISKNYSKNVKINPYFIVIHETDNTSKGADSTAHYNYWNSNDGANSSVHFVVDNKQVMQLLELNEKAWHVGDNKGHSDITNNNSIGIEICVNSDGDYNKAYNNCIELVRYLLKTTSINHIVRHYDASGKHCPRRILDNNLWEDFINKCVAKEKVEQVITKADNKMDKDLINKQLYSIECSINNIIANLLGEMDKLKIDLAAVQDLRKYI